LFTALIASISTSFRNLDALQLAILALLHQLGVLQRSVKRSKLTLSFAIMDFKGRTLEQELGKGWVEGIHPEDRERCSSIYNSSFDSRRPFHKECRFPDKCP
jgi:hypothetical protein